MGMFGSIGKWVGGLNDPGADGISTADKLMALGLSFDGADGMIAGQKLLSDKRQLAAKQAFGKKLGGMIGGSAPTVSPGDVLAGGSGGFVPQLPKSEDPVMAAIRANPAITGFNPAGGAPAPASAPAAQPRLNANSPELAQLVLDARNAGYDMSDVLEVLKMQQPSVQYDRGYGYDSRTGKPMGGFHADVGEGRIADMDANGMPTGVRNLPGYTRSVAEVEGAKAGAQEEAKAGWDLVEVPVGGQVVKLPRAVAAPMLARQAGGLVGDPNFGRTQTPGARIREEGDARAQVERDAAIQSRAAGAARQLEALDNMEGLLPDVVAGFGAGPRLQVDRALAAAGDKDAARRVTATETFLNQGRVLVADMIKSFGANPTEGERKYAERMSGADADLNPETLREGIRLQRERIRRDLTEAGRALPARTRGNSAPPSRAAIEAEMRRRGLQP